MSTTGFPLRENPEDFSKGRILGRSWDKGLKSFPPCYSQSPLLMDFTPPPPPPSKSGFILVCFVIIGYGNLKPENSPNYVQNPQQNSTFMNSASGSGPLFLGTIFWKQNPDP
jgi:hypothetical protein